MHSLVILFFLFLLMTDARSELGTVSTDDNETSHAEASLSGHKNLNSFREKKEHREEEVEIIDDDYLFKNFEYDTIEVQKDEEQSPPINPHAK